MLAYGDEWVDDVTLNDEKEGFLVDGEGSVELLLVDGVPGGPVEELSVKGESFEVHLEGGEDEGVDFEVVEGDLVSDDVDEDVDGSLGRSSDNSSGVGSCSSKGTLRDDIFGEGRGIKETRGGVGRA